MMNRFMAVAIAGIAVLVTQLSAHAAEQAEISGELKTWHKITLTLKGPAASESDVDPNPFTDFRFEVAFEHEDGGDAFVIPGYFAADGNAAESSASEGDCWRVHFAPPLPGKWNYQVRFLSGPQVAIDETAATSAVDQCDGVQGSFIVDATDKSGRDFRAHGRLQYVGERYLRFAESGIYFLKAGPDSPETLLGYADFDGTEANKSNVPLKSWAPHVQDWRDGDPTWQDDKGKGLIGAINYLAEQGCNSISFLPYNAGGDGDNVWPFTARDDKFHYDVSKLDQWQIVFDHAQAQGVFLHFKLQETEIDDNRVGLGRDGEVPTSLDGGALGPERKLYLREMIARFGYELALNWNLGEENTQSAEEQRDMAAYLRDIDPYDHHIVVHTYPNQQDLVYPQLIGDQSVLTGASLQNSWRDAHRLTIKWIDASRESGKQWVICNDEQNPASHGVPPDPGYDGQDGIAVLNDQPYDLHDIRERCLWGTLMAGGAGVEYYFGYQMAQNDLVCEDFRSREQTWEYCRIALEFFRDHQIPYWEMENADELTGNPEHDNRRYCFAKANEVYLVYLPSGRGGNLKLDDAEGDYSLSWFNPRTGDMIESTRIFPGGSTHRLPDPPSDTDHDWLAVVRRR